MAASPELARPGGWDRCLQPASGPSLTFKPEDFDLKQGQRITKIALQEAGGAVWWDALAVIGTSDAGHRSTRLVHRLVEKRIRQDAARRPGRLERRPHRGT